MNLQYAVVSLFQSLCAESLMAGKGIPASALRAMMLPLISSEVVRADAGHAVMRKLGWTIGNVVLSDVQIQDRVI
jgi:hypothetical protein